MNDLPIREVPDDVVAALDTHAIRLGTSRVEVAELNQFSDLFADLDDPEVMERAWR